ncbi:MAG: FKBP-type peptidyl-prolyl cis-trans isomerase [Candidatus Methanofastidiosia archaeon]
MVSMKKNPVNNAKKKTTKVKKRKIEKFKRKQDEKKFLYKNKKTIRTVTTLAIIAFVIVSSFLIYQSTMEKRSTVELGDEVKFNFISYYDNNEVIQHTIVPNPDSVTVDTPLDDNRLKMPQRFIIGGYKQVEGLLSFLYWNDDMLLGLKKGKTYTISIPAEQAYSGPQLSVLTEEERVFSVPRDTETKRYGVMELNSFTENYGEPEVGKMIDAEGVTLQITEIDDTIVTYEYYYEIGDEIYLEYGKAIVTGKTEDQLMANYIGEKGVTFYIVKNNTWLPAHVKEVTEDELHIEIDHFNYKLRIESITKDTIDEKEWNVSDGDLAIVRYIGYYEDGEVFDSSIKDPDVELSKDLPLDNTYDHDELIITIMPGQTIPGTQSLITGFNDALKGMNIGDEKIIEVSPEDGYGIWDPEKVEQVDILIGTFGRFEVVQKEQTMSIDEYITQNGYEPLVGAVVSFYFGEGVITKIDDGIVTINVTSVKDTEFIIGYFKGVVTSENDSSITIERIVKDGDTIAIPGEGSAIAHVNDDEITLAYDPTSYSVGDSFAGGKITNITDTYIELDKNHPMAGKTLFFKLRLINFRKVA